MAYKRKSPMPIIEGGTNAQAYSFVDGTTFYDGTRLGVTDPGTAGQVLTSNGGSGSAPTYQAAPAGSGASFFMTIGSPAGPGSINNNLIISATAGTTYQCPWGYSQPSLGYTTTQTYTQFIVPVNITCLNLFVNVTSNASTSPVTVTLNVNSVNSTLVATIPAGTTGVFSDTTHTVAVTAGQFIQWQMSAAATGNVIGSISMGYHT